MKRLVTLSVVALVVLFAPLAVSTRAAQAPQAPSDPNTWTIDSSHTAANFAVKHMLVSTVRGTLGPVKGTVTFDGKNLASVKAGLRLGVKGIDNDKQGPLLTPEQQRLFDALADQAAVAIERIQLVADVGPAIRQMIDGWKGRKVKPQPLTEWWAKIDGWRAVECLNYPANKAEIMPQFAIERLYAATKDRAPIITTEVGQHQMWAAQHFHFHAPNKWLTSGGLGTMGYGMPAAIGAQMGNPDALVIDIAGEASIQMNIQEMGTATQYRLPIKDFILNNE